MLDKERGHSQERGSCVQRLHEKAILRAPEDTQLVGAGDYSSPIKGPLGK